MTRRARSPLLATTIAALGAAVPASLGAQGPAGVEAALVLAPIDGPVALGLAARVDRTDPLLGGAALAARVGPRRAPAAAGAWIDGYGVGRFRGARSSWSAWDLRRRWRHRPPPCWSPWIYVPWFHPCEPPHGFARAHSVGVGFAFGLTLGDPWWGSGLHVGWWSGRRHHRPRYAYGWWIPPRPAWGAWYVTDPWDPWARRVQTAVWSPYWPPPPSARAVRAARHVPARPWSAGVVRRSGYAGGTARPGTRYKEPPRAPSATPARRATLRGSPSAAPRASVPGVRAAARARPSAELRPGSRPPRSSSTSPRPPEVRGDTRDRAAPSAARSPAARRGAAPGGSPRVRPSPAPSRRPVARPSAPTRPSPTVRGGRVPARSPAARPSPRSRPSPGVRGGRPPARSPAARPAPRTRRPAPARGSPPVRRRPPPSGP